MEDLSKSIDQFLSYTNIQDHHYGIPKVNYHSSSSENELYSVEFQYHQNYKSLITKLNELIYLNEMKQLSNVSSVELNHQYESIISEIPSHYHEKPLEYLESQNDFKTNVLLNSYLEITLPILRSIHHSNHDLTSTETIIQTNLQRLYSIDHQDQEANINKLISAFNENHKLNKQYQDLTHDIRGLFQKLGPKLKELKSLDTLLQEMEIGSKSQRLQSIRESQLDTQSIKKSYKKLTQKWAHISILCDVLPNLIMCLPLNWFDDITFRDIIERCGEIREKFDYYQTLVNKESIKEKTIDELLMIDLDA